MSASDKIMLYSSERSDLKIDMQLYFTEQGALFFDGYDSGSFVKETFGSYDYEYTFTVPAAEVDKFYIAFNLPIGNRQLLLQALKDRFGINEGYSEMTKYMKEEGIAYETFFWH